ncbi:MAG: class II aldolase/adducin family protein [Dehalococcoidia bacterium]
MTGEGGSADRRSSLVHDLIEVGRDLWEARLVSTHGGNLSVRWERGAMITKHGAMLHRLAPEHLVTVDSRGRPTASGETPVPSNDTPVHLAIYAAVEEAGAIAHAHPVYAVALSLEWGAINPMTVSGGALGRVPVIEASGAGVAPAVARELREHRAVLVRAHGVFARGRDPWEALQAVSVLEESAMILHLSSER